MRTAKPTVLIALLAALGAGACASAAQYGGESSWPVVAVEVTNNNWMDVVVYAVTTSRLVRLGSVTTGTAQRFDLPRTINTLGGDLFLEARPVGSSRVFRSQPILATPGARVLWSVESEPVFSSLKIAD